MNQEKIQKFLAEEEEKIRKADELFKQIEALGWWRVFFPNYWRLRKELSKVIRSFSNLRVDHLAS